MRPKCCLGLSQKVSRLQWPQRRCIPAVNAHLEARPAVHAPFRIHDHSCLRMGVENPHCNPNPDTAAGSQSFRSDPRTSAGEGNSIGTLLMSISFRPLQPSRRWKPAHHCMDEDRWMPLSGKLLLPRLTAITCLLYTSPSPRDLSTSRMPSSA